MLLWLIFGAMVVGALALDLGVSHRHTHEIKLKEALIRSAIWIGLALIFAVIVTIWKGHEKSLEFLTGYIVEESLSVDNLFVFLIIFSYFKVPKRYEHEVLFWGIIGACITRGIFIALGVELVHRFQWILYFFGGFLILTAVKLFFEKGKEVHPEKNMILRLFKRVMPVTPGYEEGKFFVRKSGALWATPLFIVLLVVESTDVVFAVDSIPAILGVTHDPFIIYTSNIFAILGLRSLFFALSGVVTLFHHLHYGLALILAFVGVKMLIHDFYQIPIVYALLVIAMILFLSVAASLIWPQKN